MFLLTEIYVIILCITHLVAIKIIMNFIFYVLYFTLSLLVVIKLSKTLILRVIATYLAQIFTLQTVFK